MINLVFLCVKNTVEMRNNNVSVLLQQLCVPMISIFAVQMVYNFLKSLSSTFLRKLSIVFKCAEL